MNDITKEAVARVRKNQSEYYLKAYDFAKKWVNETFKPFTSEDIKAAFYEGNEKPNEPRVWGAVISSLRDEGLIFFHGYTRYKAPEGHQRPSTQWISLEYRKKQQSNALMPQKAQLRITI